MDAGHLPLQAGVRLLHIGPHKTGTTAIQGAFHLARERLADEGVVYPSTGRQPLRAILAVTGQPALLGEPSHAMANWEWLVAKVREAGSQRVMVSSEFFAEADDEVIPRVIEDMGGPMVHVAVTLRPLIRILPSQWQQYMQNGYCFGYLEWLEGILSDPPDTPTPGFWARHRHDRLIERWANVVGPENVTAIVVDKSDPRILLGTFESMLGLPAGLLVPESGGVNRSLTLAEAEIARMINEEFSRQEWPSENYATFVRNGAVKRLKARIPAPGEPGIVTPAWALKRATEIGAEMVQNISALGVHVIGDISALCPPPGGARQEGGAPSEAALAGSAGPLIPAEAAAQAILGAFTAGGVDRPPPVEEPPPPEPDARTLARALTHLGRQRVQRALHIPRPRRADRSRPGQPSSASPSALPQATVAVPALMRPGRTANNQVTVVPADSARSRLTVDDHE
jgi:hypothetical protein